MSKIARFAHNAVSIVTIASLIFGNVTATYAQTIIVDPSAPGNGFITTGAGAPTINITTPQSGVSLNQFSTFNVGPDGVILNNSATGGVATLGVNVTGNPNLIVSGPANVIVNEVTGSAGSMLAGTTEVFGQSAAVIIANPNGISCNGCRFINATSSTLTTGVPTINGAAITLGISEGTITVGPGGMTTPNSGGLFGRHIFIDGLVSTTNTGATNDIIVSGGSQSVTLDATNLANSTVLAAPILTAKTSPFGVDASAAGKITSGIVRVLSSESALGVNLYGDINAKEFYAVSSGNLFFGKVTATNSARLLAIENIRQYGDLTTTGDVEIGGRSYTLYQDAALTAVGDIDINAGQFVVIAGEVSGDNIAIDVSGGRFTNTGFVLADGALSVVAGEDALQQRSIATEYDVTVDPALKSYIAAYQSQLLAGGAVAEVAAEMLRRANLQKVVEQYIDRGASMSGTDVTVSAVDDIRNTGGAIAATNNVVLTAGANIINEFLALKRLLVAADGCAAQNCGYAPSFFGGEILAGNDLVLDAGKDIQNIASTMAAANNVVARAGDDIVNALTYASYVYDKGLTGELGSGNCAAITVSFLARACTSFGTRRLLELTQNGNGQTTTVAVMAPALIASLYGDVRLEAGGNFDSVGSDVSAGDDLSIDVDGEIYLGSIVSVEGVNVPTGPSNPSILDQLFANYSSDLLKRITQIFGGVSPTAPTVSYYMTSATSDLAGRTISLKAGGNVVMTGARILAEDDLTITSATGSVLVDSTDLPDEIPLPSGAAEFVSLNQDLIGQIFGSAQYYQTQPAVYTEFYNTIIADPVVAATFQTELSNALTTQILLEVARRFEELGTLVETDGASTSAFWTNWALPAGWPGITHQYGQTQVPPTYANILAKVLLDQDVMKTLRNAAYVQVATSLGKKFTGANALTDISEGGVNKLLNDILLSETGKTQLDALSTTLISKISTVLTTRLTAEQTANPAYLYPGYQAGVWRFGGLTEIMSTLQTALPATGSPDEAFYDYDRLQFDKPFMRQLVMKVLNRTAIDQGLQPLFVLDQATNKLVDPGYDLNAFVESEEIERIVLETARIMKENHQSGSLTFEQLRQLIIDDPTNRDTNLYGVLPQLLLNMQALLRDKGGDIIALHYAKSASTRVRNLDSAAVIADATVVAASTSLVASVADRLGDQALAEVKDRIATNTSDYLGMLTRLKALTAVEALRRADSGADIKDAVLSVGVQNYTTLLQGMDEAAWQQVLAAATTAAHDTFNANLATLNAQTQPQMAALAAQIAGLKQTILDLQTTIDPAHVTIVDTQFAAWKLSYDTQMSTALSGYQTQVASETAAWDAQINAAKTFGYCTSATCQQKMTSKVNALMAQEATYRTTQATLASQYAAGRLTVLQAVNAGPLEDQLTTRQTQYQTALQSAATNHQATIASTTTYWDQQIASVSFGGFCSINFCEQKQQQKLAALNALVASYQTTLTGLRTTFETDKQALIAAFNVDALTSQKVALETNLAGQTATYAASEAALRTTLESKLSQLGTTLTNASDLQALLEELGGTVLAKGSVNRGSGSLAAALTAEAFPELGRIDDLSVAPDGRLVNLLIPAGYDPAVFAALETEIAVVTAGTANTTAAAQLLAAKLAPVDAQYAPQLASIDGAYTQDTTYINTSDGGWSNWNAFVNQRFPGRKSELCGGECGTNDKAEILSALATARTSARTPIQTAYNTAKATVQQTYAAANLPTLLASLTAQYATKPDLTPKMVLGRDKAEQDAFLAATAWRFSLEGGLDDLKATPRTIVYAGDDLSIGSALDVYVEGATTIAAGDDLSIVAGRRIGLLAAINSQFRLTENAYAAFKDIGDALQLGTLMRDAYSTEITGSETDATAAGSLSFAEKTRNYQLASTVLTSGGDLVLAANGAAGEILNYGGSLIAGENLIASASGDIGNFALRTNFTLTKADGCGGSACGNTGHDYKAAEMLAGSGMILTSGNDIINEGSILSAAGTLMAKAEGDILNQAITSQYLYYYVNRSSLFGLIRKKKLLYRAAISEGVMTTEYGDLILEAGADILNDGSVLSAGGAVDLTAEGNISLLSRSEELQNYYKRRGFSGLSYGQTTTRWNEFSTALSTVEGTDIYMTAGGNILGEGSVLMAYNDIDLIADGNITFDAHQNARYNYSSGWSIGITFGGSGIVQALMGGGDVLEAYMATNPALAAVHQLATSKGKWDDINGMMALGMFGPELGSAINHGAEGPPTIADSLASNLNPFDWLGDNALFQSIKPGTVPSEKFADYLNGITIRLGFFSSKSKWTESYFSKLMAGNDLWLDAGKDVALVGGTSASAGNNAFVSAGKDVLMTALTDTNWSKSSAWGVSVGFAAAGPTFGFDVSGSSASGKIYTNAVLTAGADLDIISGEDTILMGANVQGRNVYLDVGGDLTLASQQDTNKANSYGFKFSVAVAPTPGYSGGISISNSNRTYTDNVSSIIASDRLSIYVTDTTYLMGATLASKIGNLELDTANLVFDNYVDSDVSVGVGLNGNFTNTTEWNAAPGVDYSNTQGITHATIGSGTITLRNWENYDLSKLNRDIDNVQEVISSQEFHIHIPGVNLKRWAAQVKDTLNLFEGATTRIPDQIKNQGKQAVDQFQDLILQGLTAEQAAQTVSDPWFREMLKSRQLLVEGLASGTLSPDDQAALRIAILQGETVEFDQASQEFMIIVECGTSGFSDTPCGAVSLVDFQLHYDEGRVRDFIQDIISSITGDLGSGGSVSEIAQAKLAEAIDCAIAWQLLKADEGSTILADTIAAIPAGPAYDDIRKMAIVARDLSQDTVNWSIIREISFLYDEDGLSHGEYPYPDPAIPQFILASALLDLAYIAAYHPENAPAAFQEFAEFYTFYRTQAGLAGFTVAGQSVIRNFAENLGYLQAYDLGMDNTITALSLQTLEDQQAIWDIRNNVDLSWEEKEALLRPYGADLASIMLSSMMFLDVGRSGGSRVMLRGSSYAGRGYSQYNLLGKYTDLQAVPFVPGRVQSRINLATKAWDHLVKRHYNPNVNASRFTISESELRVILKSPQVVGTPVTSVLQSADGVRYVRVVTLGSPIGIDKYSGFRPTSTMTIMTDRFGNLVSAHPGL